MLPDGQVAPDISDESDGDRLSTGVDAVPPLAAGVSTAVMGAEQEPREGEEDGVGGMLGVFVAVPVDAGVPLAETKTYPAPTDSVPVAPL